MEKIYLLTSETGSGKTTQLQKWIDQNKSYCSFAGILSPVINGERYIKDTSTDKLLPMLNADEKGKINTGRYTFSQSAFSRTKQILKSANAEWIIIDEFGPLELKNQGLNPAITELLRSPISSNLQIIVMEKLLKNFPIHYSLKETDYDLFSFQRLDTSAAILAKGQSSRMGFNKALADFDGIPLINILTDELKKIFTDIKIITNEEENNSVY